MRFAHNIIIASLLALCMISCSEEESILKPVEYVDIPITIDLESGQTRGEDDLLGLVHIDDALDKMKMYISVSYKKLWATSVYCSAGNIDATSKEKQVFNNITITDNTLKFSIRLNKAMDPSQLRLSVIAFPKTPSSLNTTGNLLYNETIGYFIYYKSYSYPIYQDGTPHFDSPSKEYCTCCFLLDSPLADNNNWDNIKRSFELRRKSSEFAVFARADLGINNRAFKMYVSDNPNVNGDGLDYHITSAVVMTHPPVSYIINNRDIWTECQIQHWDAFKLTQKNTITLDGVQYVMLARVSLPCPEVENFPIMGKQSHIQNFYSVHGNYSYYSAETDWNTCVKKLMCFSSSGSFDLDLPENGVSRNHRYYYFVNSLPTKTDSGNYELKIYDL